MECCLKAVCEAQTEALLRVLPYRYVWRVFGFVMLAQDEVCKCIMLTSVPTYQHPHNAHIQPLTQALSLPGVKQQDECVICLEGLKATDTDGIAWLQCGHT